MQTAPRWNALSQRVDEKRISPAYYWVPEAPGLLSCAFGDCFWHRLRRSRSTLSTRAVATALCAVRSCEEHETPHRGVATRRLRARVAALLYGTRLLLLLYNCRHASSSSGPTFFSAIVRSSYLI